MPGGLFSDVPTSSSVVWVVGKLVTRVPRVERWRIRRAMMADSWMVGMR